VSDGPVAVRKKLLFNIVRRLSLFLFTHMGFSRICQREAGDLFGRRAEGCRIERAAEQCDGRHPFYAGNQESEGVGVVFQSLAVDRRAFGVDLRFVAHWVVDHLAVEGDLVGVAELVPESGLGPVLDGIGRGRGHPLERLDFVEVDAFAGVGEGETQRPRWWRASFSGLRIH
jgi:hypothetical protein